MTKLFVCFFLLLNLTSLESYSQKLITNISPNISYDTPGTFWVLFEDQKPDANNKGIVKYKHSPILDSSYNAIEPVFAIVYENLQDTIDFDEYSVNEMRNKSFTIKKELLGGFPQYSSDKHSVVFKGEYIRDGVEHMILLGYIVSKNVGVEIICDATSQVYNRVEDDFKRLLKSVRVLN